MPPTKQGKVFTEPHAAGRGRRGSAVPLLQGKLLFALDLQKFSLQTQAEVLPGDVAVELRRGQCWGPTSATGGGCPRKGTGSGNLSSKTVLRPHNFTTDTPNSTARSQTHSPCRELPVQRVEYELPAAAGRRTGHGVVSSCDFKRTGTGWLSPGLDSEFMSLQSIAQAEKCRRWDIHHHTVNKHRHLLPSNAVTKPVYRAILTRVANYIKNDTGLNRITQDRMPHLKLRL